MVIPENDKTYLDRLLTSEQATGLPHILNLDPDVNVRRTDYRSLSDAYNYYLGGGRDAAQADFPIQASGITTQVPVGGDPERIYKTPSVTTKSIDVTNLPPSMRGGTGITTAGAPTVEQTAAMEDIGAMSTMPTDYEWEAAQMGQPTIPTDYEAEAYGAPDTIASLQNVTPEAQGAWQKVQSGLASAGDFIRDYGMATYNFLRGNIGAGLAGIAGGPVGIGLTAGLGALQTTPEQKAMQSAAQAAGIADPNDPRKDIYGKNIVSAFGDYDQSVADSIATLEESGANPEKLAALKNYQNEKEMEDVDTDMARDEAITARDAAIDAGIIAADKDAGMLEKTMPTGTLGPPSLTADTTDTLTSLDLTKGQPVFDERLGWIDPATELSVEAPRKTELDIALASGEETLSEKVYNKKSQELKNLEIQKQTIQEMPISDEEKQKMIDQLDPAIKDLEDFIEKNKEKIEKQKLKVQKTSLIDLTDVGEDEEDIITPRTPDFITGGRRDEPAPTPRTPDFITGGRRDEPAPSAPTGISGPPSRGGTAITGPSAPPGMGGGGGNKIVCTMMNDSYGFGSFRNKIWLRQSKNLAPEYQIGYHKIFLPLVKLSKKNIVLKKILEHIAVHRTIDIRQEARGKTHILGRIYRKILEPICYWVGKYGKRT